MSPEQLQNYKATWLVIIGATTQVLEHALYQMDALEPLRNEARNQYNRVMKHVGKLQDELVDKIGRPGAEHFAATANAMLNGAFQHFQELAAAVTVPVSDVVPVEG